MRIVLDSNILVRAAWKADGLASRLLRSIIEGPHRLLVSPFILGEVARVLAYPRIQSRWGLTEERIQKHVNSLAAAADIVASTSVDRVVPDDPDDDADGDHRQGRCALHAGFPSAQSRSRRALPTSRGPNHGRHRVVSNSNRRGVIGRRPRTHTHNLRLI